MWLIVFRVFEKNLVHVCTSILVEFVRTAEDNKCDFTVTKNTQFIRFLHHTEFPLVECYLSITLIRDARDLYFLTSHGCGKQSEAV